MKPQPIEERLARAFADALRKTLSREEWREMGDRNYAETDNGICHSHDFCDANMVMAAAFEQVVGRKPDVDDENGDVAIWSKAWDAAMPMLTRVPCPTIFERVESWDRGMSPDQPGRIRENVPCEGSLYICPICGAQRFCGREGLCLDGDRAQHTVRRRFCIDDVTYGFEGGVPGWTRGERWNGWACPRFERDEALAILAYQDQMGSKGWFDEQTGEMCVQMDPEDEESICRYPAELLVTSEGPRTVWPVGAWGWVWDEQEEG